MKNQRAGSKGRSYPDGSEQREFDLRKSMRKHDANLPLPEAHRCTRSVLIVCLDPQEPSRLRGRKEVSATSIESLEIEAYNHASVSEPSTRNLHRRPLAVNRCETGRKEGFLAEYSSAPGGTPENCSTILSIPGGDRSITVVDSSGSLDI